MLETLHGNERESSLFPLSRGRCTFEWETGERSEIIRGFIAEQIRLGRVPLNFLSQITHKVVKESTEF